MIVVGAFHPHPVAMIGTLVGAVQGGRRRVGIVLLLKAFASGCSAVTGVEAISNGVPAFRKPRVRTAQRTEISLGRAARGDARRARAPDPSAPRYVPRGGVTILAQVTAGAFGHGLAVLCLEPRRCCLVLGLAANTSFGGLPVLMSLLAKDHRLPHFFYLRAERPVYRYGIVVLAILAGDRC